MRTYQPRCAMRIQVTFMIGQNAFEFYGIDGRVPA
jgi:hypothetical protein